MALSEDQLSKKIEREKEVFELEIKVGKPNSINGIDDIINNPRYATTIGLIKYVINYKILIFI